MIVFSRAALRGLPPVSQPGRIDQSERAPSIMILIEMNNRGGGGGGKGGVSWLLDYMSHEFAEYSEHLWAILTRYLIEIVSRNNATDKRTSQSRNQQHQQHGNPDIRGAP